MASTLQLVDTDQSTVLLDLNGTNGDEYGSVTWALLSDVEFSAPTYANDRFNFASADGGTTSSHRAQLSQVTFRVLPTATSYDNLAAGVNRLAALLANGGTLKWIPNGSSNTRFRDFEPSDSPVLFEGRELGVFNATALFKKPEGVTLQLAVQPFFYGGELDSASNILTNATMLRDLDADGEPDGWGAVFSPDQLAGLDFWYDAAAITADDDDPIAQWDDLSGSADHLVQATGADQPLYKTAIRNSLPVVRFDGTSDFMRNSALTARSAQTIFIVAIKRSEPGAGMRGLMDRAAASAAIGTNSTAVATNWVWNANSAAGFSDTGIPSTSWHIVSIRVVDATSMTFRAEGGAATATVNPDDAVTTGTRITTGHSTNFSDVDVAEIIGYSSALSAADHDSVGEYLATKWGFTWTAVS
jgi:hypothetical protein